MTDSYVDDCRRSGRGDRLGFRPRVHPGGVHRSAWVQIAAAMLSGKHAVLGKLFTPIVLLFTKQ